MMTAQPSTPAELLAQSGKVRHVLTLTPFYPVAGDDARGCFVAEPLPWLEPLGVTNSVIAVQPFYQGSVQPAPAAVSANWSRFFSPPGNFGLPVAGAFLFASILPNVRRLHRGNALHVIHAHSALPCGHATMLLGRELQIPFVVTVHGLDAFFTNQVRGYAGKWAERVARMVYRSAARVICVSEKVRDEVLKGMPSLANTVVVHNGVDTGLFAPAKEVRIAGPILSVGNLIPIKGHELLLRAFAAIHEQFPEISLEIVGDGPELSRLRELAASLAVAGKIRFLGRQTRSQVAEAMRRCTLFALPSRYEALGCVYLEAMAAEKPVIGCRGQGIEEVVQNGWNGSLMFPEDMAALRDALVELLQDPRLRQRIGMAARATILENFTLAHQAARLAHVYRECHA